VCEDAIRIAREDSFQEVRVYPIGRQVMYGNEIKATTQHLPTAYIATPQSCALLVSEPRVYTAQSEIITQWLGAHGHLLSIVVKAFAKLRSHRSISICNLFTALIPEVRAALPHPLDTTDQVANCAR
jgi:hypothetical protein